MSACIKQSALLLVAPLRKGSCGKSSSDQTLPSRVACGGQKRECCLVHQKALHFSNDLELKRFAGAEMRRKDHV